MLSFEVCLLSEVPMPRKPRFFIADLPTHIVQRGNNRQPVFFAEDDYGSYLNWLGEAADRWGCAIHAYVLMTNHYLCEASHKYWFPI